MSDGFDGQTVLPFFLMDSVWFTADEDPAVIEDTEQAFDQVRNQGVKFWNAVERFRRKANQSQQRLHSNYSFEKDINRDNQNKLEELYEEVENICRAFTDVTDAARWEAPQFYQQRCAHLVEGNNDVRPDWWLDQEYGIKPK